MSSDNLGEISSHLKLHINKGTLAGSKTGIFCEFDNRTGDHTSLGSCICIFPELLKVSSHCVSTDLLFREQHCMRSLNLLSGILLDGAIIDALIDSEREFNLIDWGKLPLHLNLFFQLREPIQHPHALVQSAVKVDGSLRFACITDKGFLSLPQSFLPPKYSEKRQGGFIV